MPYFGNYGCINTGYCHWGNFNRWISKFGSFRLKVNDPMQCVNCKTKDCATACPVGLSTQPGNFITQEIGSLRKPEYLSTRFHKFSESERSEKAGKAAKEMIPLRL